MNTYEQRIGRYVVEEMDLLGTEGEDAKRREILIEAGINPDDNWRLVYSSECLTEAHRLCAGRNLRDAEFALAQGWATPLSTYRVRDRGEDAPRTITVARGFL